MTVIKYAKDCDRNCLIKITGVDTEITTSVYLTEEEASVFFIYLRNNIRPMEYSIHCWEEGINTVKLLQKDSWGLRMELARVAKFIKEWVREVGVKYEK